MNSPSDSTSPPAALGSESISPRQVWDQRYATLPPDARQEPTPFVARCLAALPRNGYALDVAAGAGRHSLALARQGWQVDAVDISLQGLHMARQRAEEANLRQIRFIVADLERPWLPHGSYDLILVSFFLYRPLFDLIKDRLKPGGWLIYETLRVDQPDEAGFTLTPEDCLPRRKHFLESGELKNAFTDFELLFYQEGLHRGRPATQLLARKLQRVEGKLTNFSPSSV